MSRIPLTLGAALLCMSGATQAAQAAVIPTDVLSVNVSEDAYEGDAAFTLSIDKTKIGGNLTATALHSKGQNQNFTVTGSWGPGAHTVTIRFLQDAYGGSATKDRNLYVNSVTYDGVVSSKTNVELGAAGGVDFPVLASSRLAFAPGVNLSGLELNSAARPGSLGHDYVAPTTAELDYFSSKGLKIVRLPFLWERLQPGLQAASPSTAFNANYLKLITNILTYADSKGMGVIVEPHNYAAYNGIKITAKGGVSIAQFAAFWRQAATALKGYHALIGYDLMNEPNTMPSPSVWPAAAQAATTAIRQVDMATPIVIEGDYWSGAPTWQTVNGNLNIVDPASSLIYQTHVYGDRDNSGSHFTWSDEVANGVTVNTIAQRVAVFDQWCHNKAATCMVGEVGVGDDSPNWNTQLANGLAQMKADGLVSATYWVAGPWWTNYAMSIEPQKGVDRSQMSVLTSFVN